MKVVDVQEVWLAIERDAMRQRGEGYVLRRASPDCRVDLFLGIRRPENHKALMLRVPSDLVPEPRMLPETRGLRVTVEKLPDDPSESASIVVQLRDVNFIEVFTAFCTILVNRVCGATTSSRAAGELLSQVTQWQRFLDARSEGLSEEGQRGLYGELYLLRRLLKTSGRAVLVGGWIGPSGAAQDFRFGEVALEVKTSIAGEPQAITVNGERQLDDSGLRGLYLGCLSIDRRAGVGETLPALVRSLRDYLKDRPVEAGELESGLVEFGYLDVHEQRYKPFGFSIRNERFYIVQEGFPRITEANLPSAVGQVHYRIALAGCASYAVSYEDMADAISATTG